MKYEAGDYLITIHGQPTRKVYLHKYQVRALHKLMAQLGIEEIEKIDY